MCKYSLQNFSKVEVAWFLKLVIAKLVIFILAMICEGAKPVFEIWKQQSDGVSKTE